MTKLNNSQNRSSQINDQQSKFNDLFTLSFRIQNWCLKNELIIISITNNTNFDKLNPFVVHHHTTTSSLVCPLHCAVLKLLGTDNLHWSFLLGLKNLNPLANMNSQLWHYRRLSICPLSQAFWISNHQLVVCQILFLSIHQMSFWIKQFHLWLDHLLI